MTITPEQALARLMPKGSTAFKVAKKPPTLKATKGKVYVFDDNGRTIVTPNDDTMPPVLAEFTAMKTSPELAWVLEEYATNTTPYRVPAAQVDIEPLMTSTWNQKAPYWNNLKYPNPNNAAQKVYCVTGCVATAIAQVLYYWARKGRKRGCIATEAYTTKTYKYNVVALPSIPMFDWDSMTDAAPTTTKGKKAVALLMEYCGKSVKANFGYNKTDAPMNNVVPSLRDYFGMGKARFVTSATKMHSEILAELKNGSPVIMCGQSAESGCHCFVCDGYRASDDLFHFNWGWGGDGDGWFNLSAMTPNNKDFSKSKVAVVGLQPYILGDVNGDGRINISDVSQVISMANKGEYDRQADINADSKVDNEDAQEIVDKILGKTE